MTVCAVPLGREYVCHGPAPADCLCVGKLVLDGTQAKSNGADGMKRLAVSILVLAMFGTSASPAFASSDWERASSAVRRQVVSTINAEAAGYGAAPRATACFAVRTLKSRPSWATATFWSGMPSGCNPSDGFGIAIFRRVDGMWLRVASISGGQDARCIYQTKPPTYVVRLLHNSGICP